MNLKQNIWLAPAKLNLFLHITGRRDDGYHLLQTIFQFIDLNDELRFDVNKTNIIALKKSVKNVEDNDNIVIKAAKLLQQYTDSKYGVTIEITKNIPMGGGLGGGSSDAATTLLALNTLWQLNLPKKELMSLGLQLGADVPIFIYGQAAWAEGVGEHLTPINLSEPWYLVIFPNVGINTSTIFSSTELTRDKDPIKIRDFLESSTETENVFEGIVSKTNSEVRSTLNWLNKRTKARLTGTGACIFASFDTENQARTIANNVPEKWQAFVAKGLNKTHIEQFYWGVAKR